MDKKKQEKLAEEFERDAQDGDAWAPDPAPSDSARATLGTQVTVRLDGRDASRLRQIAAAKRVGYTSLLRDWIQDRLRAEDAEAELILPGISQNGFAVTQRNWVSGAVRWTKGPHKTEQLARDKPALREGSTP